MRKHKLMIMVLTGSMALSLAAPAYASETDSAVQAVMAAMEGTEGVSYDIDENGVLTISGTGEVAGHAFELDESIVCVVLKEGITAINEYAFYGCSFLERVELPKSLTRIGTGAFEGCGSLKTIQFAGTAQEWNAVENSAAIVLPEGASISVAEDVTDAETLIPDAGPDKIVNEQEEEAEAAAGNPVAVNENQAAAETQENNAVDPEDPNTVREPGAQDLIHDDNAGVNENAAAAEESEDDPGLAPEEPAPAENVTPGDFAQTGEQITEEAGEDEEITLDAIIEEEEDEKEKTPGKFQLEEEEGSAARIFASNTTEGTIGEVKWSLSGGTLTISGKGRMEDKKSHEYYWNANADEITSVVIKKGVTYISSQAFAEMYNLTSVSIADTVKEIGDSAFYGCSALEKITLPNSVTKIPRGCFAGCSSLASLTAN